MRNAIAVSRRNVRIKHEAGLLFYKWAVAIGEKLEQIELRKPSSHEIKDVTEARKQTEEDFLDEGFLSFYLGHRFSIAYQLAFLTTPFLGYFRFSKTMSVNHDINMKNNFSE